MSKKKTVVINRSKWRCGDNTSIKEHSNGVGFTALRNSQGYKCCLGFICESVLKSEFVNVIDPRHTKKKVLGLSYKNSAGRYTNTKLTQKAIEINDNGDITRVEKEHLLKELFNQNPKSPYQLRFVGKYRDEE